MSDSAQAATLPAPAAPTPSLGPPSDVADMPSTRSPAITVGEVLLLVLGALALAILTSWPLVLHLSTRIEPDLGDPVRTAWQIAEEGHQLLHHPLALFQTNAFWPDHNSLTFSDSLLGYSPAGLIGAGTVAALVRYNLLFIFAWTLPLVGAYLLGRELGLRRAAAAVAGVAFTYAPFKAAEAGHLHVLSSGGIALALFLLLRGYRRSSTPLVLVGWLVATWQLSLGFTLGLPFSYTLLVVGAVTVVLWWRRGRPALPRGVVLASAVGIALFLAMGIFEARPYLQTAHDYPSATRAISIIKTYSADLRAWLSAPTENRVWGSVTSTFRAHVNSKNESVLFPGLTILVLAIVGMTASVFTRRLRWWLLGGALVFALLALGLDLLPGGYPYRLLYDFVPGWKGVRVPGRIYTMTALGLALLAGAGAHRLLGAVSRRHALAPLALATLLVAAVVFEGAGREAHPVVPTPPASTASLPQPQLWLPTNDSTDRVFQYWSVDGYPQIANGVSTFDIPAQDGLRGGMQAFPDAASVRQLQQLGIRTVILDPQITHVPLPPDVSPVDPPDPYQAAARSVGGLPVTVTHRGPLVIYEIHPLRR